MVPGARQCLHQVAQKKLSKLNPIIPNQKMLNSRRNCKYSLKLGAELVEHQWKINKPCYFTNTWWEMAHAFSVSFLDY